MNKSNLTVAVGLSGGVDSSVSAKLLKDQGYNVIALFMKNWEDDELCPAAKDYQDVIKVCQTLDIPYYTLNFSETYYEEVFQELIDGLKKGTTPNPDILCNKEIKFKHFLNQAKKLGADFLATGHYCQVERSNDQFKLVRGLDTNKDQSYFLYTLGQEQLKHVLFPIGHLTKPEVRSIAKQANLANSEKKDSTGICFIGKRNFKDFISTYIPMREGNILDERGNILGRHQGVFYYTIGQRKGLGIGGEGDAWFVIDKDIHTNELIVAQGHDHPKLLSKSLLANQIHWVNTENLKFPLKCSAKIRYRQKDEPCIIESFEDDQIKVTFLNPVWAATLGQSIVFYDNQTCLGGAIISHKCD